jgi:NADH-quinone oxidoreductase subunit N
VYQGAPTPITGFMGSSIKLAGFVLAIKIFGEMFVVYLGYLGKILDVLAVLTMFVGNIAALLQTNLKRMFAYSSISHAGYLLLAVSLLGQNSSSSAIYYYLMVYGIMFLGLFAMLTFIEEKTKSTHIQELSGLGFTYPMFSICLTIFAISAAGIPPTAGFLAKYLIFLNAVSMGKTFVVVLAVISSLIGVFYYLKVLVYLYMKEPTRAVAVVVPNRLAFAGVVFCAFCLIYFMLFPSRLGVYF